MLTERVGRVGMAGDSSEHSPGIPTVGTLYAQPTAACNTSICEHPHSNFSHRHNVFWRRCTLTVVRMNAIMCGYRPRLYFLDPYFSRVSAISGSVVGRPTFLRFFY